MYLLLVCTVLIKTLEYFSIFVFLYQKINYLLCLEETNDFQFYILLNINV